MLGGMWSVAYTDMFQLGLVASGLAAALPFALGGAGGLHIALDRTTWPRGRTATASFCRRCIGRRALERRRRSSSWWDVSLMLMFGGIPWNCYFQRVLSCTTPRKAQRAFHSGRAS